MKSSPRMFCGRHHDMLIVTEYLDLYHCWPRICFFCRSHNPVLFTGFLAWVTRWVPPVEWDLLTIQKHIIQPRCLKVDQSFYLPLYCIVEPSLSCYPFLFVHSVVCPSDYLFFIFYLFVSYFVFNSILRNVFSSEDICRAIHITFNTLLCAYTHCHVLFTKNIP